VRFSARAVTERPGYGVALHLPPVGRTDPVYLFIRRLADALQTQGHRTSFIEIASGRAEFKGNCPPDEIDFGFFLNSNFPAVKDGTTGEIIRQVPVGSFPQIALFSLPCHFDTVYMAATHAERLAAIFHLDPGIPAVLGDQFACLELPASYYLSCSATPLAPRRKLLYVANIKGTESLAQILSSYPRLASQSRRFLEMLREDHALPVPAIVSDALGMEYREWVKYGEWRSYAEALQKTASLIDRLGTLKALSGFPCHYVLNASKIPVANFHPDSTFSGPIGFDRLMDLYLQHGGIVANLPSRIPNVLSERVTNAMAHGMIPIVPDKGEHMGLLNGANAIFYAEKVSAIREAIGAYFAMDDDQRLTISRNAYVTAAQHFSPDAFAGRVVAAYEKIATQLST